MEIQLNKFPNPVELERISTLRKYQKLYDGEQYSVLGLHDIIKKQYEKEKDIVYLANPIPARVADFYGDFVAGDTGKMIIKAGSDNKEVNDFVDETVYENDLKEKVNDYGTVQSEFGFVALLGWINEDELYIIEEIPQDQYFPQEDGSIIIATYKKDPSTSPFDKNLLLYTKKYSIKNEDCIIERAAWRTDERGVVKESYSLESMAKILGVESIEPITIFQGVNDIPIRQVDNTNKNKWGFGKSDFADSIPQLSEINERMTHISTALLQTLDAKMQLPSNMFDEEGKVKIFDSVAMESKDSPEAKYITNDNPLLAEAREHIITQTKMISFATAVPMFELLKTSMPERVESLKIQLFQALRKTEKKRAKIKRALNDLFRVGFKLKGIEFDGDIDIIFSNVLPVDEQIQADTESVKVTSGLTSRKSAIMRLEGVTEKEADEELKRIQEEDKMSGVLDVKNPPTFQNDDLEKIRQALNS